MEAEILDHANDDKETERKSTNGVASSSTIINAGLERPETGTAGLHVVIDVHEEEEEEEERICRICHLSGEEGLMELGCHCKAGLGISHPCCAETWFKHKGNSVCEVCGVRAKNVKLGMKKCNNRRMFIVDYDHEIRAISGGVAGQDGSSPPGCCKQSCCNFLLAFLVIALVLPWFLKTHLF